MTTKPKYRMMELYKRHIIIGVVLSLLLGWGKIANAQVYTYSQSSGTTTLTFTGSGTAFKVNNSTNTYSRLGAITVNGGKLTMVFNTSTIVFVVGQIRVTQGEIEVRRGTAATFSTLKRGRALSGDNPEYLGPLFNVQNSTATASNCKLTIDGSSYPISIHGEGDFNVSGSNTSGWTVTPASPTSYIDATSALLVVQGGEAYLTGTNLNANWNAGGNGGAVTVVSGTSESKLEMTNCNILRCYAKNNGGAIYFSCSQVNGKNSSIKMTNCDVGSCYTLANGPDSGGTFRTLGNSYCTLEMIGCHVHNCMSVKGAGVLTYNAAEVEGVKLTNCTFDYNYGTSSGAIMIATSGTITNCTIDQNYSATHGGGITCSWSGSSGPRPNWQVRNGTLTLDANTRITNNTAVGEGGGIYFHVHPINVNIGDPANAWTIYNNTDGEQYEKHLIINGATITGNQADKGGGISVHRETDIYKSNLEFNYGTIEGNTALTEGGGIYVTSNTDATVYNDEQSNPFPWEHTELKASFGGTAGQSMSLLNNAACDGGGVYLTSSVNNLNFFVKSGTTIGSSAKPNRASNAGGGVFIDTGETLTMTGGSISYNISSASLGGGVYMNGKAYVSGLVTIANNNNGSKGQNNVFIPASPTEKYVHIGEGGLLCGSSIGITKTTSSDYTTTSGITYTQIATGSTGNCVEAFRNNYFFDDAGTYDVYHANRSPYINTNLYFSSDPTWALQGSAAIENTDYTQTDGFATSILTAAGFAWFANHVKAGNNYTGKTVTLANDVSLAGHAWDPVGCTGSCSSSSDLPFSGTFDGQGHTVSDLECYVSHENMGLFGYVKDGMVKNVIVNGEINAPGATNAGGIVGHLNGGEVRDSYSSVGLTGSSDAILGGLMGKIASGSMKNCYANANFAHSGTGYFGGLVGENAGTVENCYSRIQNAATPASTYFGYLVGDNTNGSVLYSYAPTNTYTATGKTGTQTGVSTFTATSTPYLYKHNDNQVDVVSGNGYITNGNLDRNGLKGLLATLNKWVDDHSGYSSWMRTSASPINDDYPIHNYTDYVCVGSKDNVTLEYSDDFNTKFNEYITAGDGTLYLYQSPTAAVTSTLSNNSGVPALYIQEDVAMLHTSAIKAHVGITLDNSAGADGATPSFGGTDAIDWHFFSSALADAPIGLVYGDNNQYGLGEYPSWNATFTAANAANGYFPTNLDSYYDDWDFYAYCEPDYHWVNLKRNSASHWHEDWPGINIPYTNDTEFVPGKGYMVALKDEGYLQGYGTLNTNTGSDYISVPVTCTSSIGWTTREGHNLLGNPYQSYLDFDVFARKNDGLWKQDRTPFYIIMDEDNKDYVLYTVGQSPNAEQASRFLHPHQGFMIDCDVTNGTAKFDNDMRTTTTTVTTSGSSVTWDGGFRGGEDAPCYPLVNMMATDANGNRDIVTVELGRPDKGGALKQDAMHTGKGSLWCRYDDEDYALVFTQPGLDAANIRFACDEDAEFTMTWSTHNGAFSYLHLIDNMTGADIDCLSTSEYKFSARESDYNSRFRLVFDYTGLEENEDGPSTGSGAETFAYYANGEIHLTATPNGTAQLQIIDMTGRTIVSRDATRHISTQGMAAGVYVLRLTDGNGTKTQKIILD